MNDEKRAKVLHLLSNRHVIAENKTFYRRKVSIWAQFNQMSSTIWCLFGAGICFGMFIGFGPMPDNQVVAIFGAICLFFAYVCFLNRLDS